MKQLKVLLALCYCLVQAGNKNKNSSGIAFIFLLTLVNFLTNALPFQHLVTFDPPDESLKPKEITVAAGLQVSPRIDGTGDYALKEVQLISRKRSKEITIAEDEKFNENKSKDMDVTKGDEENGVAKNVDADQVIDKLESAEESSENALGAVVSMDFKLNPLKVKHPGSGHIYITIPIYVNSMPGLPVTLSIGTQQLPLQATAQGIAARRQALEEEESPTSLYNKLL